MGCFLGSLCFEGRAGRRVGRIISSAPSRLFFSPLLFTLDVRLYFVPVRVFWRSRWNKSGFATDALFFSEQKCVYRAVVSEQPEPKEHSFLCRAFLEERQDSVCTMPVNRKVLLYISKDSLSEGLRSGDELIFLAHVSPPSNNGNPDEFDYARYLRYKGISGIAFVASGN